MISGNVNQRIEVDSINLNLEVYPYETVTYARQFVIRSSNITERSLVTYGLLQKTVRSDENPQGLMLESFEVIENKDIKTSKR